MLNRLFIERSPVHGPSVAQREFEALPSGAVGQRKPSPHHCSSEKIYVYSPKSGHLSLFISLHSLM